MQYLHRAHKTHMLEFSFYNIHIQPIKCVITTFDFHIHLSSYANITIFEMEIHLGGEG
jgi:hypothetical protein